MRPPIQCFLLISLFYLPAQGQDVFINEMSQGSAGAQEWVELIVRTDGVDLRGWELGDNDDGVFSQIVEFTNASEWANVATGTIIVIYNGGDVDPQITTAGGPDLDFSDDVVLIPHSNMSFFTDASGGWPAGKFANDDKDDGPTIRDVSDTIIHDMVVAHPTATVSAPGTGKVKFFTSDDPSDLNDESNWTEDSASSSTPGSINPGQTAGVLPVELTSFTALVDGRAVLLRWETASETNNAGFDIQHRMTVEMVRATSLPWETLAFVDGYGTTERPQSYAYRVENLLPGRHRFRLKQIDFDGTVEYSPEVEVAVAVPGAYHLSNAYPNPFYPKTSFSISVGRAQHVEVAVYDLRGRRVAWLYDGALEAGTTRAVTFASGALPSGLYLIRIRGEYFAAGQAVVLAR